jgi:hypothetical protein
LNLPHSVELLLIVVLALAGFAGAEEVEKKFSANEK